MGRGLAARRGSAADCEQRGAAFGAVALPAGTTIGEGDLPRIGDGDPLAADTSTLRSGLRQLWSRVDHAVSIFAWGVPDQLVLDAKLAIVRSAIASFACQH